MVCLISFIFVTLYGVNLDWISSSEKVSPKYDFKILSFCSKNSNIKGAFGFEVVAATIKIFWCRTYKNVAPSIIITGAVCPVVFCAMIYEKSIWLKFYILRNKIYSRLPLNEMHPC